MAGRSFVLNCQNCNEFCLFTMMHTSKNIKITAFLPAATSKSPFWRIATPACIHF